MAVHWSNDDCKGEYHWKKLMDTTRQIKKKRETWVKLYEIIVQPWNEISFCHFSLPESQQKQRMKELVTNARETFSNTLQHWNDWNEIVFTVSNHKGTIFSRTFFFFFFCTFKITWDEYKFGMKYIHIHSFVYTYVLVFLDSFDFQKYAWICFVLVVKGFLTLRLKLYAIEKPSLLPIH